MVHFDIDDAEAELDAGGDILEHIEVSLRAVRQFQHEVVGVQAVKAGFGQVWRCSLKIRKSGTLQ